MRQLNKRIKPSSCHFVDGIYKDNPSLLQYDGHPQNEIQSVDNCKTQECCLNHPGIDFGAITFVTIFSIIVNAPLLGAKQPQARSEKKRGGGGGCKM